MEQSYNFDFSAASEQNQWNYANQAFSASLQPSSFTNGYPANDENAAGFEEPSAKRQWNASNNYESYHGQGPLTDTTNFSSSVVDQSHFTYDFGFPAGYPAYGNHWSNQAFAQPQDVAYSYQNQQNGYPTPSSDISLFSNQRQGVEAAAQADQQVDTKPTRKRKRCRVHEPVPKSSFQKPFWSYASLAAMAIKNSSTGQLPVNDIYSFILENFPFYRTAGAGWKNSIRHNLCLNKKFFVKIHFEKEKETLKETFLWALLPSGIAEMEQKIRKWSSVDPDPRNHGIAEPSEIYLIIEGRKGLPSMERAKQLHKEHSKYEKFDRQTRMATIVEAGPYSVDVKQQQQETYGAIEQIPLAVLDDFFGFAAESENFCGEMPQLEQQPTAAQFQQIRLPQPEPVPSHLPQVEDPKIRTSTPIDNEMMDRKPMADNFLKFDDQKICPLSPISPLNVMLSQVSCPDSPNSSVSSEINNEESTRIPSYDQVEDDFSSWRRDENDVIQNIYENKNVISNIDFDADCKPFYQIPPFW